MPAPGWVLDASVAVKLVVAEEGSDRALGALRADLAAPALLTVECASVLWKMTRRGIMAPGIAAVCLADLARLPVRVLADGDLLGGALDRALRHGHSVYDGLYLQASALTGWPLLTDDRRLARLADDGASVTLLADLPAA